MALVAGLPAAWNTTRRTSMPDIPSDFTQLRAATKLASLDCDPLHSRTGRSSSRARVGADRARNGVK